MTQPESRSTDTNRELKEMTQRGYKYGFISNIDSDSAPPGLSEDIVRFIAAKKHEPEWMLEWRLDAYRRWLKEMDVLSRS